MTRAGSHLNCRRIRRLLIEKRDEKDDHDDDVDPESLRIPTREYEKTTSKVGRLNAYRLCVYRYQLF